MYKTHKIFPLIVYQGQVEIHDQFKEESLSDIRDYWYNSDESGVSLYPHGEYFNTPENSGKLFVHQKYPHLFESIKKNLDEYLECLDVMHEKLSYHIMKSWVGVHQREIPQLTPHAHNESNISFVYYLKSDPHSDKFCAMQRENPNEISGALFEGGKLNLLNKFNSYNCNYYTISPIEGTILFFPSHMLHQTMKVSEIRGERIAISGDIRVTLNQENYKYHQSSNHPSQWLELS
jgi:hypothetical protein